MKDRNLLLLLGGGALAAYVLYIRPKQEQEAAFSAGAGAVDALGAGLGNALQGIPNFFVSLLSPLNGIVPNVSAAVPQPAQKPAAAPMDLVAAQAKAAATWAAAGGSIAGKAYIMPAPVGQVSGLTVQQPAITNILTGLAGSGYTQPLATVTTVQDVARVQATRAVEAEIKAAAPAGTTVIGHRTQGGVNIYTVRSPTGAISIVRK